MDWQLLMTVLCGLAMAIGVLGIVVPILPGSLLIAAALLAWALAVGGPVGWWVFGLGLTAVGVGASASAVLTGRRLKQRRIPNRSILVGLGGAVVGLFVVPVVGLIVGFIAGLLLAEYLRLRELGPAVSSSWAALKATGIGILVECALACLAVSIWVIGVWIYFAGR